MIVSSTFRKTAIIIATVLLVVMFHSLTNERTLNFNMISTIDALKKKFSTIILANDSSKSRLLYPNMTGRSLFKEVPCEIHSLRDYEKFFQYGRKPNIKCKKMKEIGKLPKKSDGSKFTCFDDHLQFKRNNCVVLSFGLGGNWNFENEISEYGCVVHGFDPTININIHSKMRRDFIYHPVGLKDKKSNCQNGTELCKYDRYENIVNFLGLNDTIIDYLKIDIEGSELLFFSDVLKNSLHLLKNVNQIGMEIHPGVAYLSNRKQLDENRFGIFWKQFQKLECEGFRLAHWEMNIVKINHYKYKNRTESQCYEVLWIRK